MGLISSYMEVVEEDIRFFQKTIRDYSSYDFSEYSINSLRRRLSKILLEYKMDMLQITSEIRENPKFLEEIVKKITVTTTELFRDPEVWKHLRYEVLPRYENNDTIRIWHPGCSTGQEAYALMILLNDMNILEKSEIYASDLNADVLDIARKGRYKYRFNKVYLENFDHVLNYSYNDSKKMRDLHWNKYLTVDETKDSILMKEFLRDKPFYKKVDLVKDKNPFLVEFDLIICRNVIIYFNYELQNKVFDLFHKNLNRGGCLLLGLHESILGPFSNLFIKKEQFYFKK